MNALGTILDLVLVVIGFGMIIFVHELGHFLAARWAGIRVLAFALGFGPALVSYRKGLGWRRGSSEREALARADRASISATEYRLNALPFGGYVKMLGQEDGRPGAVSDAPDSYQACKPWKRMVVISAGVVMNLLTAALLFMIVFKLGLRTEPAIVGDVTPGSPASRAVAADAHHAEPGLKPGDRVLSIDGRTARSFNDLVLASAMASPGATVAVTVDRAGHDQPLHFRITPEVGRLSGMLELGVGPPTSATLRTAGDDAPEEVRQSLRKALDRAGLAGVEPGATLVGIDGQPGVALAAQIDAAFRRSGGREVSLDFRSPEGQTRAVSVRPRARLQQDLAKAGRSFQVVEHVLGLTPVMRVAEGTNPDTAQGLRTGDVLARVGAVEYPSIAAGIAEVRAHAGRSIDLLVLRPLESGSFEEVPIRARVNRQGAIGFFVTSTAESGTLLAMPPPALTELREGAAERAPPALALGLTPGSRLASINGRPVSDLFDAREALREATADALAAGTGAVLELDLEPPRPEGAGVDRRSWALTSQDVRDLHALGWESPVPPGLFEPAQFLLKAEGPLDALRTGVAETHRVMLMTYVTFARLFQGTVKVEHLKGPVGIAHLGTLIADRGLVWLLFFLALISVNLAVINFLPLPIVDGGQFLFLVVEQIRGRPAPMAVQNAATLAGLALIGAMFIIVTFNDVMNLFGR